jgi:hypothetical protein
MRQLIGKIPIKYLNVTEEIYFSELVRCQHCQTTVPMGIEVVTVRKEGKSKKVTSTVGTAAHTVLILQQRRRLVWAKGV